MHLLLLSLAFFGCLGAESPCIYTAPNGDFYDLSPLSSCTNVGYSVPGDEGFSVNICKDVNSGCGGGVAVCQGNTYNCGVVSKATFSPYSGGKGVVLTYGGGSTCPNGQPRTSEFTFICDQNAKTPQFTFDQEQPQCHYTFTVRSVAACPKPKGPQVNLCPTDVFLVPHTHDDVGWLQTIDGYYQSEVKNIIDTSLAAMIANPERRFIYVEQAYFTRWWHDPRTSDNQRQQMKTVVARGQWEFVLGGWVMPDEAATTYSAVIDQLVYGHQFILENFNVTPTKGWQIDPFGASSVTPLVYRLAGFDGHIVDRITHKDRYADKKELQFNWQGSPSLPGPKTTIFSEMMGGGGYCDWLGSFDFSQHTVTPQNVAQWGHSFISMSESRIGWYKTPNLLAEWGCDFAFQDAAPMFKSMDLLMSWLQQNALDTGYNVKYATLSDYFASVKEFSSKNAVTYDTNVGGDFFPLLEGKWWSGYFTSRVQLKGFARRGESTLHAIEPIFGLGRLVFSFDTNQAFKQVEALRVAHGDVQHHDGVTGTSVPDVVEMYKDDLIIGMENAVKTGATVLNQFVKKTASSPAANLVSGTAAVQNLRAGASATVVVYNSLAWTRSEVVAVPVNLPNLVVTNTSNVKINSSVLAAQGGNQTTSYILYFVAQNLPPLGYQTFFVTAANDQTPPKMEGEEIPVGADVTLENTILRVTISGNTGRVASIYNKKTSVFENVDANLFDYTSKDSGAYAFGPAGPAVSLPTPTNTLHAGTAVSEVWQVFTSYAKQSVRLFHANGDADIESFLEIKYDLGPLPSHSEIVTRFSTSIATNGVFHTDNNGYQYLTRQYNWDQPIQGNYYPLVYGGYINDDLSQLSVISERSHGASSLSNGQFEVMVHRNPDMGDGFGPGLTDTTEVYPSLRILLDTPLASPASLHKQTYYKNFPVSLYSTPGTSASWLQNFSGQRSFVGSALPPQVHLLGLNSLNASSKSAILRFVHLFGVGEDAVNSQPVTVNVLAWLRNYNPKSIVETTVSANSVINETPGFSITLQPAEIRTFVVSF